ncbi:MAG: hypothetical protein WCQ69_03735 [Bacteroidales bacterium]|jgi:hypothetical protein|nr:hypothetical protein [Bacteroidales bacterium]MDD2264423.1 hypothetical protein [Bacteroidales bacterium]MDD2831657.1 hypothetical protein [Bacteroidales bacterium]MDD3209222.1 hypothetical protein [Bacteroidales bacterium]MDD3697493.1 hypothetical protein [Bacteroidales bacterium]
MTILISNLQPVYDWLANLWQMLFGNAGQWADDLYVFLNQVWDIFQNIFTFLIK